MAQVQRATTAVRKGRTVTPSTVTSTPPSALSRVTTPGTIQHLKGVLFGPPKTGKTVAGTNTEGKALLVLTEPEGDLSIRHRTNIDVFRPEHWRDLDMVTKELKGKDHGYSTVCYDSVTFMFELVGGADVASAFRENKDIRKPYGNAGAAINQIIYSACALDMNVIFTAQLKVEGADESGEPLDPEEGEHPLSLAITPMIYKVLVPAVSFIGRTYKRSGYETGNTGKPEKVVEYWVSFEDHGRSPAGSRIEVPEQVRNLNLDTLLATIKKEG